MSTVTSSKENPTVAAAIAQEEAQISRAQESENARLRANLQVHKDLLVAASDGTTLGSNGSDIKPTLTPPQGNPGVTELTSPFDNITLGDATQYNLAALIGMVEIQAIQIGAKTQSTFFDVATNQLTAFEDMVAPSCQEVLSQTDNDANRYYHAGREKFFSGRTALFCAAGCLVAGGISSYNEFKTQDTKLGLTADKPEDGLAGKTATNPATIAEVPSASGSSASGSSMSSSGAAGSAAVDGEAAAKAAVKKKLEDAERAQVVKGRPTPSGSMKAQAHKWYEYIGKGFFNASQHAMFAGMISQGITGVTSDQEYENAQANDTRAAGVHQAGAQRYQMDSQISMAGFNRWNDAGKEGPQANIAAARDVWKGSAEQAASMTTYRAG